jgi:hypothetical protein
VKTSTRKVVFFRDFQGFSGGHLKVWDYFNHVRHVPGYMPEIYFSEGSRLDSSNPWHKEKVQRYGTWKPGVGDILFLAGMDWQVLPEPLRPNSPVPIVNLIQGFRHADPGNNCYRFLSHRAVRICVSSEVAEAVKRDMQTNSPVYVIPNGLDTSEFPTPKAVEERAYDVFIGGSKTPDLAVDLHEKLLESGTRIKVITEFIPREEYLDHINNARVVVLLPMQLEGFFLPALEAMALDSVVVCPDCVGNRSFCVDGHNCLRPDYTVEALVAATRIAISLNDAERLRWIANARGTVAEHNIAKERASFIEILNKLDSIWNSRVAE